MARVMFHNYNNAWSRYQPFPRRDPYHRQDTRVEYEIYSNEYFSGADVHLYIGDIWVDEVTSIDFVLEEQVLPIYGYSSYTFDTVARGQRIVRGQFSINFTSTGYLQQILEHAEAIQYALETGNKKQVIDLKYYQKLKLDQILKLYGKESFEQIAEEYEKAIWGELTDEEGKYLSNWRSPYFQKNNPLGLDIRIHYGPVEETIMNEQRKVYSSKDPNRRMPSLTVESINGIQITGFSKRASTSDQGAPIQEVYTFIARDINGASIMK
ncbi:hypothetical protein [Parageobacillus galactosidasius]|uniref:Uncharacterized protein n=1 Tax=Parageobacillus galactosidasius TaxID=883812 RepID=A0A226QQK4_9BACL|nr:hypothetical protein [Parageobacillus galactosidasius]OXB94751.1 hypothetical protein B9L23_07770 [Parageobacillus galactosidasius]